MEGKAGSQSSGEHRQEFWLAGHSLPGVQRGPLAATLCRTLGPAWHLDKTLQPITANRQVICEYVQGIILTFSFNTKIKSC